MNFRVLLFAVMTMGLSARAADVATTHENVTASTCIRDVIYFHNSYTVFLRLHIEVDGSSFDVRWRKQMRTLFNKADADHDGRLTPDEIRQATNSSKSSKPSEMTDVLRLSGLWTADKDPFDKAISFTELIQLMISRQLGPFQPLDSGSVANRRRLSSNTAGIVLFDLLDRNKDRKLSTDEFARASESLRRRDIDDDGTFSIGELSATADTVPRGNARQPVQSARPFEVLIPGTSPIAVLREMMRRSTKNPGSGKASQLEPRFGSI